MEQNELLEKLNRMIENALNKKWAKDKDCNFLSVSLDFKQIYLNEDYSSAKNRVDKGGYVLVIDKQKIYTYKTKTEAEYMEYLKKEIKRENSKKMNFYGL